MSILNGIKFQLLALLVITFSIFISYGIDIWFYNYFQNIDDSDNGLFLKEFFIDVTQLGRSSWYFAISIVGFIFFYFIKKSHITKKIEEKVINFFISSFIYLVVVGVITQILKHIIGRPRPNYTNFEDVFIFKFFSLESNFHSFPSGHSSTIFMVCFILVAAFPRLRYFFLFFSISYFSKQGCCKCSLFY